MAGLPEPPAFANAAIAVIAAADPILSTPAVAPGAVDLAAVGRESRQKRKISDVLNDNPSGVTVEELGLAACREVVAIAEAAPDAVLPPWFQLALQAAIDAALPAVVNAALPGAINAALPTAIDAALPTAIDAALPAAIDAALPAAINAALPAAINAALPVAIDAALPAAIGATLPAAIDAAIDAALPAAIDVALPAAMDAALPAAVNVALPAVVNAALPAAIGTALGPTHAMVANIQIHRHNRLWLHAQSGFTFRRPSKHVKGFAEAPPIPEMAPPNGMPADIESILNGPPPAPGVDVVPPPALPFMNDATTEITQAEIGYLAMWYNDTFGIEAGDNHMLQLHKLRVWLCGS
ncbi:hypothetical protein HK405_012119 [Cladochytrium tenue]|nr:hypothetical protein HK405_012119 [Cladochytrium tenue]